MKKVSKSQIEEIYTYIEKRNVQWYDVQTELVDHLANGIENQWGNNPNISFGNALTSEFKKFGLSGFQNLVEEKTKTLNKYYRREVWLYFKTFFRLPKIILTLCFVWGMFNIMHVLDNKQLLIYTLVVLVGVIYILHVIIFKINIMRRKKKTGRKWLFDNRIMQLGGLGQILNIGIWSQNLIDSDRQWTNTSELIVSILIVLYVLALYISIIIIPVKLKQKISKQNPEYNFLQKV